MPGDEVGPLGRVRAGQYPPHLGQRHVELPEAVDHLRRRDLLGVVVPVAGGVVDTRRREQTAVVVAAQGADVDFQAPRQVRAGQALV